jgi:phage-related baseplate assembly protein
MMREAVFKDELYEFLMRSYNLSCISERVFKHFSDIYKGEYKGLAYAISAEELLAEWQFYIEQLRVNRSYKSMSNDQALIYDLAVILSKNAEYRELMERKKIEERAAEMRKAAEVEIDAGALRAIKKNSKEQILAAAKRRADLFREVTHNGN